MPRTSNKGTSSQSATSKTASASSRSASGVGVKKECGSTTPKYSSTRVKQEATAHHDGVQLLEKSLASMNIGVITADDRHVSKSHILIYICINLNICINIYAYNVYTYIYIYICINWEKVYRSCNVCEKPCLVSQFTYFIVRCSQDLLRMAEKWALLRCDSVEFLGMETSFFNKCCWRPNLVSYKWF